MSEQQQHTAEPWKVFYGTDRDGENYIAIEPSDSALTVLQDDRLTPSNARRIVACVNACAGVPTGVLKKLSYQLQVDAKIAEISLSTKLAEQRDALLAALVAAVADHDRITVDLDQMQFDWVFNARAAIAAAGGAV